MSRRSHTLLRACACVPADAGESTSAADTTGAVTTGTSATLAPTDDRHGHERGPDFAHEYSAMSYRPSLVPLSALNNMSFMT
jgi:hypothetical protein